MGGIFAFSVCYEYSWKLFPFRDTKLFQDWLFNSHKTEEGILKLKRYQILHRRRQGVASLLNHVITFFLPKSVFRVQVNFLRLQHLDRYSINSHDFSSCRINAALEPNSAQEKYFRCSCDTISA